MITIRINLLGLIPDEWITRDFSDKIEVGYSAIKGNYNRKRFVFPKEIGVDTSFAEAVGMIIGDGDMHRKEKNHLSFCSRDIDIAAFVLHFLKRRFFLKNKDFTFSIRYGEYKPDLYKISEEFNVPRERLKIGYSQRHRNPVVHIQVNGRVFRLVFEKCVACFLNSNFNRIQELRNGFLRGLFAAEGGIAVDYKEGYIGQITFSLAPHERDYLQLLHAALVFERIQFRVYNRGNCLETIITNWKNYLKLWQIGLFDRCKRKKNTFLSLAKDSQISAVVTKENLKALAEKFTQRDLADILGSWQGNICRVLQGRFLLRLWQVRKLEKMGFKFHIKKLRIGNLTELPYSGEVLDLFFPSKKQVLQSNLANQTSFHTKRTIQKMQYKL
ncbi:hypothetical protein HYU14_03525 [Candidatus Woesearchaeota archaeon]|nr:hypothetical protein [Candidatus Woesearchaeota archaeon]